jgi:hypothetical protein
MALYPTRQTLLKVYNDLLLYQMSMVILGQKQCYILNKHKQIVKTH